jgi:GNAT superfamily N-acetyltransferase
MAKKFKITVTDNPDPLDLQIIRQDSEGHHAAHTPPVDWLPLGVFMRDLQGNLMAGVVGGSYWGWIYIATLWVKDPLQRKSNGLRMLKEAEKEGLRRGCGHAFIETVDYDSMLFYESLGYFVTKKTEESGTTRYAMQKELYPQRRETPLVDLSAPSEPARYILVADGESGFVECLPQMKIASESDAVELIGFCGENNTDRLLVHDENLTADFYDLHTRLAGEILLKMSNYRIRLAAVIPADKIGDGKFSDMVLETNRGNAFRVYNTRDDAVAWLLSD